MTTQLESIPLLLYKSSIKMWIVLFFGHNIDIVVPDLIIGIEIVTFSTISLSSN